MLNVRLEMLNYFSRFSVQDRVNFAFYLRIVVISCLYDFSPSFRTFLKMFDPFLNSEPQHIESLN